MPKGTEHHRHEGKKKAKLSLMEKRARKKEKKQIKGGGITSSVQETSHDEFSI